MFQSNSSSSSSLMLMATIQSYYDIPNDVIDIILLSLPAKSLLRFKRVCKRWYNLITDDNFIKTHTNSHSTDQKTHELESLVLLSVPHHIKLGVLHRLHCSSTSSSTSIGHDDESKLVEIDCPFDSSYSYRILGSCNGLVCFSLNANQNMIKFVREFCVWNPCTREWKMLPTKFGYYSYVTYGFGYDQSMDEYKLVSNEYTDGLELDSIQVYTLGTNSWKNIDIEVPYEFVHSNAHQDYGLFVNEALYWIAMDSQSRRRKIIICFDIKTEKYRQVSKPWSPLHDAFMEIMNLGVLDGCICMTGRDKGKKYCVDVWVMKEEYSWIRYFTITTPVIAFKSLKSLKPLRRFSRHGDAVLMMVGKKSLVRYEPERDIASYLGWCSDVKCEYATETTYIESLVSLKSGIHLSSRSELKAAAAAEDQEISCLLPEYKIEELHESNFDYVNHRLA